MTKDELLKWADDAYELYYQEVIDKLNEFFESNVCIPKGENRHPDFDVLVQALNGIDIERWDDTEGWVDCYDTINIRTDKYIIYRIKPSGTIHEWQFYLELNTLGEIGRTPYLTEYEFANSMSNEAGLYWQKDEETKRIRK